MRTTQTITSVSYAFTRFPNQVCDIIKFLTGSATKTIIIIVRLTAGYHKDSAVITLARLCYETGLCKQSVINAIAELERLGYIEVNRSNEGSEYALSAESVGGQIVNHRSPETRPARVEKIDPERQENRPVEAQKIDSQGLPDRPPVAQNVDRLPILKKYRSEHSTGTSPVASMPL